MVQPCETTRRNGQGKNNTFKRDRKKKSFQRTIKTTLFLSNLFATGITTCMLVAFIRENFYLSRRFSRAFLTSVSCKIITLLLPLDSGSRAESSKGAEGRQGGREVVDARIVREDIGAGRSSGAILPRESSISPRWRALENAF